MRIINKVFAVVVAAVLSLPGSLWAANALQVDFLVSGILGTNNKPLASGKVYTYLAGTSNLAALYSAGDKTGNATNPIILNSRGAATAYADGNYKFVIKDKNDVTIATYDNMYYVVPATMATTITNVDSTGSPYSTTSAPQLIKVSTAGGGVTLNLVTAVGNAGLKFIIIKTNAGGSTVTVDPAGSETIKGNATYTMTGTNETIEIISDNANWVLVNTATSGTVTTNTTDILSNKSLVDASTYIIDNVDNSKSFQFQASGIATSHNRVYTVPDYNGTITTLDGIETLTSKTIASPVFSGTSSGTYTLGGTLTVASPILSGTVTGTFDLGTLRGRPVVSKTTTYGANITTDETIFCDTSAAAWTLSLPAGYSGKEYIIIKKTLDLNALTISPNGAETVDGLSAYKLYLKEEGVHIKYDSTTTNWKVISYIPSEVVDYSNLSTITGIASGYRSSITLKGMGRMLWISSLLIGTGNSTLCSFTLPFYASYTNNGLRLYQGSTPAYVAFQGGMGGSFGVQYLISTTFYTKTNNTTGVAPGTDVIPLGKWGAVSLDIDSAGTITITSATNNATGYNTEILALNGIPAVAGTKFRMGTVAVTKSDGGFTFGTTSFSAANVTANFRSATVNSFITGMAVDGGAFKFIAANGNSASKKIDIAIQFSTVSGELFLNSWTNSGNRNVYFSGMMEIDRTQ